MKLDSGPHVVTVREAYLDQRVRELKSALDLAQARIGELEGALGIGDELLQYRLLGFTEQQAGVVNCLAKRQVVSREQLMQIMYADDPERGLEVDEKTVDVVVCKVRAMLAKGGIELETLWAIGWRLTNSGKGRLARLVASKANLMAGRSADMRHMANRRQRGANAQSTRAAE